MTQSVRLTHDAFFYDSDEEFAAALTPFLRDGLTRGHAAVVAVTRSNIALLRDSLGADADAVSFIDRDQWYQRPVATVAGWRRLLEDATRRGHTHVRIVGEVGFGPSHRHPTWTRYESVLNTVLADTPAWIVCPYDTRSLPATVLEDARRTHPTVAHPDRRDSDLYVDPEVLLQTVHEPLPPVAGPPIVEMTLVDSVAAARHAVRHAVSAGGWDAARLDDLLIALSEIVTNSLQHGTGRRELRVWAPERALICEVTDEGPGPSDPLVGYRPPGHSPLGGRGLWIAHQLCDSLAIDSRDGLTRVRFAVASAPSLAVVTR
jgi:anti-sigma regulatory factor (Ser/Thr protein kinase)